MSVIPDPGEAAAGAEAVPAQDAAESAGGGAEGLGGVLDRQEHGLRRDEPFYRVFLPAVYRVQGEDGKEPGGMGAFEERRDKGWIISE